MRKAKSTMRELRILAGVVALALLAAQSGCARTSLATLPPPPLEKTRSTFGRVGVTWAAQGIPLSLTLPAAGSCSGAGRGAVIGTFVGIALAGEVLYGAGGMSGKGGGVEVLVFILLLALAIAIIPLAVLIGSAYGASAAHPPEEVEAAIRSVTRAASDPELRRGMARKILERGIARSDEKLAWLEPGGSREAFDSILEVGPATVALIGPYQINPSLRLLAAFPVRMVRVSDGALLYEGSQEWQGADEAELFPWAEGEGRRIRSLLEGAGSIFAERVVEQVFLLHLLPLDREWKGGP